MPLYKITERRLKRKERDEEDGIATLKAALREEMGGGGDETDDEESESDSDSDSEGGSGSGSEEESEEEEEEVLDREATAGPSVVTGNEDLDEDEEEDEGELSPLESLSDSEEDEDVGPPPMSVAEAAKSPIYLGSAVKNRRLGPFSRCVLCPGKLLQSETVIKQHLASSVSSSRDIES